MSFRKRKSHFDDFSEEEQSKSEDRDDDSKFSKMFKYIQSNVNFLIDEDNKSKSSVIEKGGKFSMPAGNNKRKSSSIHSESNPSSFQISAKDENQEENDHQHFKYNPKKAKNKTKNQYNEYILEDKSKASIGEPFSNSISEIKFDSKNKIYNQNKNEGESKSSLSLSCFGEDNLHKNIIEPKNTKYKNKSPQRFPNNDRSSKRNFHKNFLGKNLKDKSNFIKKNHDEMNISENDDPPKDCLIQNDTIDVSFLSKNIRKKPNKYYFSKENKQKLKNYFLTILYECKLSPVNFIGNDLKLINPYFNFYKFNDLKFFGNDNLISYELIFKAFKDNNLLNFDDSRIMSIRTFLLDNWNLIFKEINLNTQKFFEIFDDLNQIKYDFKTIILVTDILFTAFEKKVFCQIMPYFMSTKIFSSQFAVFFFFLIKSLNNHSIFDRVSCLLKYFTCLLIANHIFKEIVSDSANLMKTEEYLSFIWLVSDFLKNFTYKYKFLSNQKHSILNKSIFQRIKNLLDLIDEIFNNFPEYYLDNEKIKESFFKISFLLSKKNYQICPLILTQIEIDSIQNYQIVPLNISSPYKNTFEYLENHFQLLREDCLRNLALGIKNYEISEEKKIKNEYMKINHCKVTQLIVNEKFFGLEIDIQLLRKPQDIKHFLGKHYMHGNLLILSDCRFKDFYSFIVHQRDERIFQRENKFRLIIQIQLADPNESLYEVYMKLEGKDLLIAESPAYYEGYVHILKHMQVLSKISLENLIVYCKIHENASPNYLNNKPTDGSRHLSFQHLNISTFINEWLRKNQICLDVSQKEAIDLCFKTSVSLIQGPPGTGKTFVGVNLVRLMLEEQIQQRLNGPILIVCYTNHALDQFLTFISQYTKKITRFGSRTKNPNLEVFQLFNKRKTPEYRKYKQPGAATFHNLIETTVSNFSDLLWRFTLLKNFDFISSKKLSTNPDCEEFFDFIENLYFNEKKIFYRLLDKLKISKNEKKSVKDILKFLETNFSTMGIAMLQWLDVFSFKIMLQFAKRNKKDCKKKKIKIHEDFLNDENNYDDNLYEREQERREELNEAEEYADEQQNINKKFEIFLNCNESAILQHFKKIIKETNLEYEITINEAKIFYEKFFGFRDSLENEKYIEWFDNPQQIDPRSRWLLHYFLCEDLKLEMEKNLQENSEIIKFCSDEIKKFDHKALQRLLSDEQIIGMTTTGAVKYKGILSKLNSKIVIVEEAAEVIESHIITAMTKKTEHLILIGDHMQLRPSVSDYELSTKYNLDVSLFERLINNNFQNARLKKQRRMRPEISVLVNLFYGDVQDDPTVFDRPGIMNLKYNMFFFTHKWEENNTEESKVNEKEGNFILAFANLLVESGIDPQNIVILSLYAGQLLYIKRNKEKYLCLKFVGIKTVDDYQGEECDIILLSLVRSNKYANIGFLKVDNRVNVALSRAKKGLFMFGNAECIREYTRRQFQRDQKETLWKKVLTYLTKNKLIVEHIEFHCKHHKSSIFIKENKDFKNFPKNGCKLDCKYRLECGHSCNHKCHPFKITDESPDGHIKTQFKCKAKCSRNHSCEHSCYELCGDCSDDKKCVKKVDYIQEKCSHKFKIDCFRLRSSEKIDCPFPCPKVLKCGHICSKNCGQPCNNYRECKKRCKKIIKCGHPCGKKCSELCKTKIECTSPVLVKLENCDHEISLECKVANAYIIKLPECIEECEQLLDCGHICPLKCKEKCISSNSCKKKVTYTCSKCKNNQEIKCHENTSQKIKCFTACQILLPCGHKCRNKCYEDCQKAACPEKCERRLPCGHGCAQKCWEDCKNQSCKRECMKLLNCGHKCKQKCNEICDQNGCNMTIDYVHPKCGRKIKIKCHQRNSPDSIICNFECNKKLDCGHQCALKCSQKCGESEKCSFSCQKKMNCGHMCPNKCGDICLPSEKCTIIVNYTHKQCNRIFKIPCNKFFNSSKIACELPCDKKLDCGHTCQNLCHEACQLSSKCEQKIEKKYSDCSHVKILKCYQKHFIDFKYCKEKCSKTLLCGHTCQNLCHEACQLSSKCEQKIEKKYSDCSHVKILKCYQKHFIDFQNCKEKCEKILKCGHTCQKPCLLPCEDANKCQQPCNKIMKCGHSCQNKCSEKCSKTEECKSPCSMTLDCGHKCSQKCNEICGYKKNIIQSIGSFFLKQDVNPTTKVNCNEICQKKLKCGHLCQRRCFEDCNKFSCNQKCEKTMNCGMVCDKKCGAPCQHKKQCETRCKRILKCGHQCQASMCDPCTPASQCLEPCLKKLSCGHKCKKICSEKCIESIETSHPFAVHSKSLSNCREMTTIKMKCGCKVQVECSKDADEQEHIKTCPRTCSFKKACGHLCNEPFWKCSLNPRLHFLNLRKCNEKCNKVKKCGHKCEKLCGENCEDLLSPICRNSTKFKAFCGHIRKRPCNQEELDFCFENPCKMDCNMKLDCSHNCINNCSDCIMLRKLNQNSRRRNNTGGKYKVYELSVHACECHFAQR